MLHVNARFPFAIQLLPHNSSPLHHLLMPLPAPFVRWRICPWPAVRGDEKRRNKRQVRFHAQSNVKSSSTFETLPHEREGQSPELIMARRATKHPQQSKTQIHVYTKTQRLRTMRSVPRQDQRSPRIRAYKRNTRGGLQERMRGWVGISWHRRGSSGGMATYAQVG